MTTIADIRSSQVWLGIRCEACGRSTYIPHLLLPARLAPDLPVHLAAAFFRCKGCGGKRLVSAAHNPEDAAKPFTEAWKKRMA
ncbi:DNA-directed RNA polymerase subunit RPC12/RpoP [Rhizobium aquaticum]|uniref:DNA-directed RNA polymerase subunit RPC12/RpoP n=1 Tax=Rhizobium aquaticum TaxID=1549636 RepID=A0ABV2J940_9HYPH